MKKILLLSSLALVLTACSNDNSDKTEVETSTTTTESVVETKDVFKEILENPKKQFDREVTNIKYIEKNTDTAYLLLMADSVVDKGISTIKFYAYDKEKKTVVSAGNDTMVGVAGAGGFRGWLTEYIDSSEKFRYTTVSSGTGDYTIQDIVLSGGIAKKENLREGNIRNGAIPDENTKEIAWKEIEDSSSKSVELSENSLSSEQSSALSKGMDDFGRKMNQVPYVKTDVPEKLTWQAGGDVTGYKIYESYIYQSGGTTHRYFFVTNTNGTPEVLYSTGGTSVKHTANADIAAMFVAVYNGQGYNMSPAPVSSASSSTVYENEYFRVEVPASWAGKWSVNEYQDGKNKQYMFGQGASGNGAVTVTVTPDGVAEVGVGATAGFFSRGAKLIPKTVKVIYESSYGQEGS